MTCGVLLAAAVLAAATPGKALANSWDAAFDISKAKDGLSVTAVFEDRTGQPHRLQLWRERDRIRRDTDETRIYGERKAEGESYIIEKRGDQRAYHVSQANLYRAGLFTGWDSLASLLQRPQGHVEVTASAAQPLRTAFGTCRFWGLESAGLRICWSEELAIPLRVDEKRGEQWRTTLRIVKLKRGPIAPAVWQVPRGLKQIDLNDEMDHAGD